MEKVKLTREQANAIEWALQKENEYSPDRLLRLRSSDNANFHNELYPLNDIDIAVLARALYIGYEVEPEFKVGDWVVRTSDEGLYFEKNKIFRAGHDIDDKGVQEEDSDIYHVPSNLRHATPEEIAEEKERRWWKKHGRDVWELRKGDVLYDSIEEEALVFEKHDQDLDDEVAHFTNGLWEPMRNVKRRLRVVSFVEQRLDREGDE